MLAGGSAEGSPAPAEGPRGRACAPLAPSGGGAGPVIAGARRSPHRAAPARAPAVLRLLPPREQRGRVPALAEALPLTLRPRPNLRPRARWPTEGPTW